MDHSAENSVPLGTDNVHFTKVSAIDTVKGKLLTDLAIPEILDPAEAMKFLLTSDPPLFPESGRGGTVIVAMLVNPAGEVVKATILESDNTTLNQPSLASVMKWRFDPDFVGTQRARWGKTVFNFRLEN